MANNMLAIGIALLVVGLLVLAAMSMRNNGPPPPPPTPKGHDWGSNVIIFDDTMAMSAISQTITKLFLQSTEFTTQRVALFFMPGTYTLSFKLGYYMAVYGLGLTPDMTVINGTIQVCNSGSITDPTRCLNNGGMALDNFWRACENITINPPATVGKTNFWAVSQACAMRRVIIHGNIHFSEDDGWSSGGFIADSAIDGGVDFGTQQQFMSRSVDYGDQGGVQGGAWNIVMAGCSGKNMAQLPPFVTVDAPAALPPIAPKPYVYVTKAADGSIQWNIGVPNIDSTGVGPDKFDNITTITEFDIVSTDAELAKVAALGGSIVVAPGIYNTAAPIVVAPNAVVLGVGMATLRAGKDGAIVSDLSTPASGARVGGFLLEATSATSTYLLDWGRGPSDAYIRGPGDAYRRRLQDANPSFLYDIYTRVGGSTDPATNPVSIPAMVHIGLDNTVCDNFWLWVADHGVGIPDATTCGDWSAIWKNMHCPSCLIVSADNVTFYGLAAEHATGDDLVIWNGDNGTIYFFQSEMPYHPPASYNQVAFRGNGAGLVLQGGGAYSYFPCDNINLPSGFVLRPDAHAKVFTRFLNGKGGFATPVLFSGSGATCGSAVTPTVPGPVWCSH